MTTASIATANFATCPVMGHAVRLLHHPGVFTPTLTTAFLTDQVQRDRLAGSAALDLGCGAGPIAIALALCGAHSVHAVDLMPEACDLARRNVALNGVSERVKVLAGNLFEPVRGLQFDLIVDDVSGVAEEVARFSSWFPRGVPSGGPDGTSHTVQMLRDAPAFLRPGGCLLFPVLSLSRADQIVATAAQVFGDRLQKVASKLVPFNAELREQLGALERLQRAGVVDFVRVRSRSFWRLDIYRASSAG